MKFSSFIKNLQLKLNEQGEKLVADGDPGPKTRAALEKYDVEIVIKKPIIVAPPRVDNSNAVPLPPSRTVFPPQYPKPHPHHPRFEHLLPKPFTHLHPFDVLRSVAGEHEISGSKDNSLIAHFHEHSKSLGSHSDENDYSDELPHCSSALNWAADMGGCRKTDSAMAASWSGYGNPRSGDIVFPGDIIHIKNGDQNHVTLCNKTFNRKTAKTFEGFGSNQANSIKTSTYKVSSIKSVQVWAPLPGTELAPIGTLRSKPVPASGSEGESTT